MAVITWNEQLYRIVDCGGGGNCLFSSLAYVLLIAGELGNEEDASTLRTDCVNQLTQWANDLPDWFDDQNYETPDNDRVGNLIDGDWGDATSILAILSLAHRNVRVTILWEEDDDLTSWDIDLTVAEEVVEKTVYIYWNGGTHYQALEETDYDDEDDENLDKSNDEEDEEETNVKPKIPTKLSSGSLSISNSTIKPSNAILEIHLLDVGQGESTLILLSDTGGYAGVILIDGGHTTRGGGTIRRHLSALKINAIDHLICTHYDADHVEGLTAVLQDKNITVDQVWHPGYLFEDNDQDNDYAFGLESKYLEFAKAIKTCVKKKSKTMAADDTIVIGDLRITCLSSGQGVGFQSNNHSIALGVQFHSFRYYTAGDLEIVIEDTAVNSMLVGKSHICAMKCGHHGSCTSTSKKFLKKCRPSAALISCGKHSYCHPDDLLIDHLCGAKSMQQFYLTNCYYNRAGVNPNYDTDYSSEVSAYQNEVKKKFEKIKQKRKKRYEKGGPKKQKRPLLGLVAGDGQHLGTIIVRVPEATVTKSKGHSFEVGWYDVSSSKWTWQKHTCRSGKSKGDTKSDRTPLVNMKQLDTNQSNDGWLNEVSKLRAVKSFSLLTKPPGEKKEKTLLDDDEYEFAMVNFSESSNDEGSEYSEDEKPSQKKAKTTKDEDDKDDKEDEEKKDDDENFD